MIATLSPNPLDYATTISTLRYADRAKSIRTHAIINQTQQAKMVEGLKDEIEKLKTELLHSQQESQLHPSVVENELRDQLEELKRLKFDNENSTRNQQAHKRKRRMTVMASQMRQQRLVGMGIAINVDELQKLQQTTPHLVNVTADPLMTETLLYPCREGTTRVGAAQKETNSAAAVEKGEKGEKGEEGEEEKGDGGGMRQDIRLSGLQIKQEHAVLINHGASVIGGTSVARRVDLIAMENAPLMVNGTCLLPADGPLTLCHGDWLVFGHNQVFRFKDPTQTAKDGGPINAAARAMNYATVVEGASFYKSSSTMKKGMSVKKKWGWAAQKILKEKDRQNIITHIQKAWLLVGEANSIVEEMGFNTVFSITLATNIVEGQSVAGLSSSSSSSSDKLRGIVDQGIQEIRIHARYTSSLDIEELILKQNTVPDGEGDGDAHSTTTKYGHVRSMSFDNSNSTSTTVEPKVIGIFRSTDEYPILFDTGLKKFDLAMYNLRELYQQYLVDDSTTSTRTTSDGNTLSGPMDESGNRAAAGDTNSADSTDSTDSTSSTDAFSFQYVECFRNAGITQIHLLGLLKQRTEKYVQRTTPSTSAPPVSTATGTTSAKNTKNNEGLDSLLDPEEDDANGVTNTQYLMTLIKGKIFEIFLEHKGQLTAWRVFLTFILIYSFQENAKIAHLLKIEQLKSSKQWPATFTDSMGKPFGYFSPDVKVFSDILHHDLESISSRWVSNFDFAVGSVGHRE